MSQVVCPHETPIRMRVDLEVCGLSEMHLRTDGDGVCKDVPLGGSVLGKNCMVVPNGTLVPQPEVQPVRCDRIACAQPGQTSQLVD